MEPRTCPHPTCGHIWTPRKAEPKKCPQCQNPMWRSTRPKKTGSGARQTHQTAGADHGLPEPSVVQVSNPASPTVEVQDAPEENDTLSQMKNRAEALLRQLA